MLSWIKECYGNIEICVLDNGWAGNYFSPEISVRHVKLDQIVLP